ncbi:NmrA-like family protein [Hortaea werneckii]|nr:NmrA-like family protein [Hortaea werneckii]
MQPIKNVATLGADGKLGPAVLEALVSASFTVTVLKRESSKSSDEHYPPSVKVARVPDDLNVESLATTLQGHDAFVITIKGSQTEVQKKLADAAVRAGVRRMIPADFGSCDSSTTEAQELVPLFKHKADLRQYLQTLAAQHKGFTWTSLVTGHFFDWSLPFIHIHLADRRADVLDAGEHRCSMSTLARIGEATVQVLRKPEVTENQMLYVQSFCVSQNAIVKAFEKATANDKWTVEKYDADDFREREKARASKGDAEAVEELVYYLGVVDGDWTKKKGFAMELLDLKDEDVEAVAKDVVARFS